MQTLRLVPIMLLLLLNSAGLSYGQDSNSTVIIEVVNAAGQPMKNACVTFVPRSGDIVFRKADRHGRVRVNRLHRGNYRVVVKVDGYEAQKREVVVARAQDTIAFVMHARD